MFIYMNPPESPQAHIGSFLRFARKSIGLNLRKAAEATHVNFTYLGQVERGDRLPSDSWLRAYVEALGRHLAQRDEARAA